MAKQTEQEVYLLVLPANKHTHSTSHLPVGAPPPISVVCWIVPDEVNFFGNGPEKTAGVRRREKKEEETAS